MRHLGQIRTVLLCLLGGLGFGLLLCRFLGHEPTLSAAFAVTGTIAGLLGAAALGKKQLTAGLMLAAAVACGLLLGRLTMGTALGGVLSVATALLCFGAATASSYGFYGPLGCWSTVLIALAMLLTAGAPWRVLAGLGAALALILTLDGFRESSVRKSMHLGREAPLENPFGLTGNSILLGGLFLLGAVAAALGLVGLCLLLSSAVKGLLQLLLTGTGAFGYALARLLQRFMNWILYLLSLIEEPSGGHPGGNTLEEPVYTGGPGSPMSTLVLVLLITAGTVALVAVVGAGILHQRKRKKAAAPEISDYVDEVEQLERPKWRPFGRIWQRRARSSDYQGAMKIRYAFQQLLRRRRETDPLACSKTPNELRQDRPDEDILIDAYNRVRYAGGGPTQSELDAADRLLKAQKKRTS